MQPRPTDNALIQDAFTVLLEHLGQEKTMQLWYLFFPPQEEYIKTRRNLFAGKDVAALPQQAWKFNRE